MLGERGVNATADATVAGKGQVADVNANARIGGTNGLVADAKADVGGSSLATVSLGIGRAFSGSDDTGDNTGGGSGGGTGGGSVGMTPGASSGGGSASNGGSAGNGGTARPSATASRRVNANSGTNFAVKKTRCTGVLSEPRAYDAGIVALCRELVGG
ncbi:hypothetical protein G3A50_02030 [Ancylobacter pratisalsi]|uniref:Uncharacterized protein n=1 Tax=Ancylobacter pratisalsi TaxID=1745854 RepID=A0A6P1YRM2_9HYPH|nr:hypothetical protein G3A50_02030 [Ancylobacter pratisalsi]